MTLDLTEQDLRIVSNALCALPYAQVVELITKINKQLAEQQKPVDG